MPWPFGGTAQSHKSIANDSRAHFSDCRAATAPSILSHQSLFHGCLTLAGFTFFFFFYAFEGIYGGRGLVSLSGTRNVLPGKNFLPLHSSQSSMRTISRNEGQQLRCKPGRQDFFAPKTNVARAVDGPNDGWSKGWSLGCTCTPPSQRGSLEKPTVTGLPRLFCLWREHQIATI